MNGNNPGLIIELPSTDKRGWPWDSETDKTIYSHDIQWPRISIVTPSYMQAEFIEETIRSVILQNYPNIEYIVIDGGSQDGTIDILEKYTKFINYWISEKDEGNHTP
jgi:cellulose synthase/poly-beta-1,6-N-acetylglucosamine synthase-like glycosyltransferase